MNIIQFSMPIIGSSLLFQVLTDLFPGSVISKAQWISEYRKEIVVGSYRYPRVIANPGNVVVLESGLAPAMKLLGYT